VCRIRAPKDKIRIFKEGRVPFVVRDVGNGYCQPVGECYVYRIMDREAMMREDLTGLKQDFLIQ
jgi:hypothetical protein